jgi:aminoglycoside/choline kinase family phosphotransferase
VLAESGAEMEAKLYQAAVALLVAWHADMRMKKSLLAEVSLSDYGLQECMREVALFADWFLPEVLGREQAALLREEYLGLWDRILQDAGLLCTGFVHRDYHVDNLLWLPEREGLRRVGLLDFQDALWGHPAYDLVSLLEDARRDVDAAMAARLLQYYLMQTGEDEMPFAAAYALLGAQRNSKIIGIFVRLARRDGKHGYLAHLPRVWRYLMRDLEHPALFPLRDWVERNIPPAARGAPMLHG